MAQAAVDVFKLLQASQVCVVLWQLTISVHTLGLVCCH